MFMWQGVLKGKTSEEFWFWNVCVRGGICRNGKCNLTDPVRPDGCTYRFSQQGQDGGGAISIFFCRAKNWGKHSSSAMSHLLKPPPHYQAPHVNMFTQTTLHPCWCSQCPGWRNAGAGRRWSGSHQDHPDGAASVPLACTGQGCDLISYRWQWNPINS